MDCKTRWARVLAVGAVAGVVAALTVGLSAPSGAAPVAGMPAGGYPGSWPYRAWDSRPLPDRCSSGHVTAGRAAADALIGLPPAVATTPGCLVAQEFVHGADLGVVAGEGELGQVPGVLDGPQHGVVGGGGAGGE